MCVGRFGKGRAPSAADTSLSKHRCRCHELPAALRLTSATLRSHTPVGFGAEMTFTDARVSLLPARFHVEAASVQEFEKSNGTSMKWKPQQHSALRTR